MDLTSTDDLHSSRVWAVCVHSARHAGISPAAIRHAIMVHHARRQSGWDNCYDGDPWAEWAYCLEKTGLPPQELARVRQLYFNQMSTQLE